MANTAGKRGTSRKRWTSRWSWRLAGAALLALIISGGWAWWHMRNWAPDRAYYPVQGVEIGTTDGKIDWSSLKAIGADFAYIDASASAFARDPDFVRNLEDAKRAGVQVGAVHRYDPCQPADRQAANFVTTVPRDAKMLPPAVELDILADNCPIDVSDAKVESELMTFINQVETHSGQPTVLKVTRTFEHRYHVASRLDRNLWLVGNRFEPRYAARPWVLWTANSGLASVIAENGLRWVVVQP